MWKFSKLNQKAGSHGDEYEDDNLLGYGAKYSRKLYRRSRDFYCLHQNIPLSNMLDILILRSPFSTRDHISHPYKSISDNETE
jgi:hypothetical protein